jgi:ribonuclease HII
MRPEPNWELEGLLWAKEARLVAGVDEAGRGAICGPVVVGAVILPPGRDYPYRDSKTLSAGRREELAERVRSEAIAYAVAFAEAGEVDKVNVLQATKLAALRAVAALAVAPDALVTDYLKLPTALPTVAVAAADAKSYQVAAASILAKTTRDAHMAELARRYPGYGLEKHKGYGVASHLRALALRGPTPEHRRSFAPVAQPRLLEADAACR